MCMITTVCRLLPKKVLVRFKMAYRRNFKIKITDSHIDKLKKEIQRKLKKNIEDMNTAVSKTVAKKR